MTKEIKIYCDKCERDLIYTNNCEDYRILLGSERIASRGGAVTAMVIYDPFPNSKHFCGTQCLRDWVISNIK